MPELLYRGSVKDVYGVANQDPYTFVFSDRYSIFDWGEMPDALPRKGEALAVMGDLFFRFLADAKSWQSWSAPQFLENSAVLKEFRHHGARHHSFGLVTAAGEKLLPGGRSNRLSVKALPRIAPRVIQEYQSVAWDYSAYAAKPAPMLVPLEVVFRFGAPTGSSFLKRLKEIPGYAKSFGFATEPKADEWFSHPVAEFFTKLEPTDRYLPPQEAKLVAGLSEEEFRFLEETTLLLAARLKDLFAKIGLELWDGKFEFAFLPGKEHRSFALVDSIGPDELRLTKEGVHFSKEILRQYYRDSSWNKAVEEAKQLAKSRGALDWKKICREELKETPEKLSPAAFAVVKDLYPALAQAVAKECFALSVYDDVATVAQVTKSLKELL